MMLFADITALTYFGALALSCEPMTGNIGSTWRFVDRPHSCAVVLISMEAFMLHRLTTITALSLLIAAGTATAQTSTTATTGSSTDTSMGASTTLPSDWDDTIQGAFFTDGDNPSLVEESEMTTNWEALSDEQKEIVRSHCETVDTASTSTTMSGSAGTAGAAGTTGSAGSAAADTATSGTTGSGRAATDTTAAGSSATDTDTTASTATDSASTTSATGSASGSAAGTSDMEVAEADIQELCSRVMTMN